VFVATDQWFVTVTDVKDRLLEELEESDWHPEWARDNRFRDWVENARDWNVSRQRYWGIPVPIWICEEGHRTCVGTRDELRRRSYGELPSEDELDLHRPYVDEVTVECPECGEPAERVEDVFDVWLDSAAASWASLGYPGDDEPFESLWPADLIIEAHDQTRGWFWSQLGMGVAALDETPYREVVMHGHALDEDGRKMSKSLGNIVTPQEAIQRNGVDPLRCFLLSHDQQGDDMRFSWSEVDAVERSLNVVWNTHRFPLPYMDLDGFDADETTLDDVELTTVDRWVLSRLQATEAAVTEAMEDFEVDSALDRLLEFVVEDVSRYYVQVVRPRMWEESDSEDKIASYVALHTALEESARMFAPFAPHLADAVYANLGGDGTVHAVDWPEADEALRDETLERDVDVLRSIEEAASNARQRAGRKLRWPVPRLVVETEDEEVSDAVGRHAALLRDRTNARDVVVTSRWDELRREAEPKMDVIGPEFGSEAASVAEALEGLSPDEVDAGVVVDGEEVEITVDMVEYVDVLPDDSAKAEFEGGRVFVDASLTDDIESEGYAREVVRRVQEMRKQMDLDVEAEVDLGLEFDDGRVESLVSERADYVAEETRASSTSFEALDDAGLVEDWEFEGVSVTVYLRA
ncbi:MAG: class I tRNA ligase family protein, partial [Halobacteriales archaeon]